MKEGKELASLKRFFFLLVITLTICLLGAYVYINNDTRQDRIRDIAYTASVIKEYYELSFHQWELSLLSIGRRLVEIESDAERYDYAGEALKVYEKELLAFGLAQPDGQVIMFKGVFPTNSLPNLVESDQTRRSFELTKKGRSIAVGECYYFSYVEDWILPIRVPIYDEQDSLVAVNTSAIDYSSVTSDLQQFGLNQTYLIHLISKDFGTTQIMYPLDSTRYDEVLGNDSLTYTFSNQEVYGNGLSMFEGIEPLNGEHVISLVADIDPVNHQLVVSMPESLLWTETFDRFKVFIIAYLLLLSGSIILYVFVKRNMQASLLATQSEKANLKSIIESTEDIIGLFDTDYRLIEFNQAFEISSKATDGITLYKGIDLFVKMKSEEHASLFRRYFQRAFDGEKFSEIVTYPSPEGDIIFQFTYNPIYRNDQVIGLSLFAKDVTEVTNAQVKLEEYSKGLERLVSDRTEELKAKNNELTQGYEQLKSTQEHLIRAEKMASLGVLAAGIGHEINNPLNFIKHGAEGLEVDLKKLESYDPERLDGYFDAIYQGVKRAADIVSGLSHFSRGGSSLNEACDLKAILENSLNIAATRFKSKSIRIKKHFNSANPVITGNDGKLHQLFTNIIVNAEQAIERAGEISLSLFEDEQWIKVAIKDSGTGMSEATLGKLLDPFFTTKEPGEGTGLGLFISQMIIDEHQGKMEIESNEGEGSTFTISFPKVQD